ncbi:unnamed protein product [Meloidogyne enterolobii]|uniref:Uncharacterized protein n=1 Tax=Meloidogyne enterolobii TaxID=390850 RepID=A0ACB1APP8_MELEN
MGKRTEREWEKENIFLSSASLFNRAFYSFIGLTYIYLFRHFLIGLFIIRAFYYLFSKNLGFIIYFLNIWAF